MKTFAKFLRQLYCQLLLWDCWDRYFVFIRCHLSNICRTSAPGPHPQSSRRGSLRSRDKTRQRRRNFCTPAKFWAEKFRSKFVTRLARSLASGTPQGCYLTPATQYYKYYLHTMCTQYQLTIYTPGPMCRPRPMVCKGGRSRDTGLRSARKGRGTAARGSAPRLQ